MKPKLKIPPPSPAGGAGAPKPPAAARVAPHPVSRTHAPHARPLWPADQVERWPLAKLIPYARNARTHTPEQVAQLAGSIREWGWTIPVLVDEDGTLLAGHGRILAAHLLELPDAPTMVARGWTDAQKRAYRLADNQLPQTAGWDLDMLRVELIDLRDQAINLASLGFSDLDLTRVLGRKDGLTDPDEVPEILGASNSRSGDIWLLGDHRLGCGDCTDAAVVARLLNGATPHLMVTDPPYGVEYDANWRNERARTSSVGMGNRAIGAGAVGRVTNDDRADWREAYALFPGDVAYAWSAGLRSRQSIEGLEGAGFEIRAQIIWAKQQFAIGRGHYHFQHEPCWYAVRKGKPAHWAGDRKQTSLWQIDKPVKSETGHSTQKPVECMLRPIENNSASGDRVYDPFVGSGTTIIAAEMTGRACDALEINPSYCDVTILRWQAFTGGRAVRLRDGLAFNDIIAARDKKKAAPRRSRRPKVVEGAAVA